MDICDSLHSNWGDSSRYIGAALHDTNTGRWFHSNQLICYHLTPLRSTGVGLVLLPVIYGSGEVGGTIDLGGAVADSDFRIPLALARACFLLYPLCAPFLLEPRQHNCDGQVVEI